MAKKTLNAIADEIKNIRARIVEIDLENGKLMEERSQLIAERNSLEIDFDRAVEDARMGR